MSEQLDKKSILEMSMGAILERVDAEEGVGLFEADGGMWVQTAKQRIAAYFEEKLAEEVKSGKVVVML